MASSRRFVLMALLVIMLLAVACTPTAGETGIAPEIFITPGPTETILISQEEIPQNNCDGGAVTSQTVERSYTCLLYTSPSPRDGLLSRMPSSA
mgnify:CR=1 FL=1